MKDKGFKKKTVNVLIVTSMELVAVTSFTVIFCLLVWLIYAMVGKWIEIAEFLGLISF